MIQMKKMAAAVAVAAASIGGAQAAGTTLAAGDILFSGWIQTSGVYGYGFTTFTDIAAGTDIYFTDMPYKGALGTNGGWSNSTSIEGLYKWTTGSEVTAGSQLFLSLYTAPVSSSSNYVATGVYDNLSFLGTTCAGSACNVVGSANGTTTILAGDKVNGTGAAATTSNTAIGTSDAFYIYQGGTQPGSTSTGYAITVPQIGTLLAVGASTAGGTVTNPGTAVNAGFVGGTSVGGGTGDLVNTLGGASTSTTTALDATGITLNFDTSLAKKGVVYKGPTDFTVIGSTIEGVTIVDVATSKLAAQKSFLDQLNYYEAGAASAWSLVPVAGQSFTGINTTDVQILAVPEASTYAMLLAGLGMIGFMARRRSA
jgi:hypothetical protein